LEREPTPSEKQVRSAPRDFFNFLFFKSTESWRLLPDAEKRKGVEEFISVVEEFGGRMEIRPYSTTGLRRDADFLLWLISSSLENMRDLIAALRSTAPGKRIEIPYSYLSMRRESIYTKAHKHEPPVSTDARYLFVYPFVKTREWYLLPFEERQRIMEEHFRVGHEFPNVRINTSYSFGIDDQDFVLAFETDSPGDFQTLVMRLRETESSKYTVRDTPMFTCIKMPLKSILLSMG